MPGKYVDKSAKNRRFTIGRKAVNHARALFLGAKLLFKPNRLTFRYPIVKQVPSEKYRGFIIYNKEKCISCSMCARVCPANAMKMFQDTDKKLRPAINYERCVFCGYCVDICPAEALRHAKTHDIVFEKGEEMLYMLEKFQYDPDANLMKANIYRARLDPKRGIVYERVE